MLLMSLLYYSLIFDKIHVNNNHRFIINDIFVKLKDPFFLDKLFVKFLLRYR